jgi:hypothetical protein
MRVERREYSASRLSGNQWLTTDLKQEVLCVSLLSAYSGVTTLLGNGIYLPIREAAL